MERNPFEHIRPLPPDAVTGRDDLLDHLVRVVGNRGVAALIGPRRFGKTSLLGRVASVVGDVDAIDTVTVDCFGVASVGDFAVRLERSMARLTGPTRKLIQRLISSSELGVSLAPGIGFKATFGRKDGPDAVTVFHGLLDLLVTAANRRGGLLLVLDEFQDVARVGDLDALLRTHLQRAPEVAVIFAGSRPSMIRTLFGDRRRPFYSQADIIEIGQLDPATATRVVSDGFAATGREAGDAAELIAATADGHPQRLMLLAHLLWERVDPGATASVEQVGEVIERAKALTEHEHRATVGALDRTHRDALRAVAVYGTPYSRTAERTLDLARSSAQSATAALLADAVIARDEARWRVIDPLLADWVRTNLPAPGG